MNKLKLDLLNILQEYHYNDSPERSLFLAVILQALLDATKPTRSDESSHAISHRERAISWFAASIGVTATNFIEICDMANLDSIYVRNFAYKVIHSKEKTFIRHRINQVLQTDRI
jgi:hypothetical protein